MAADASYLTSFRLVNICTGQGGVLNGALSVSFLTFSVLFLMLVFITWRQDGHRKTDKGMWRGLVFDKDQMAIFRTYFGTGKGRLHAAALILSGVLLVVSVALLTAIHGVQEGDCPAPQVSPSISGT